jgi:glycosyltransferase involved in cell wall biosynthesis
MSRVLMLTKDAQIDRRILLEADSLEAAGWQVTILAMPHTVPDTDPRVVRLQPAAQRERLVLRLYRTARRLLDDGPVMRSLRAFAWRHLVDQEQLFIKLFAPVLPNHPAEVVVAHDLPMLPVAMHAAALHGAKVAYDSHELFAEQEFSTSEKRMWRALEARTIGRCDLVTTVNPSIARELQARYGLDRVGVIYNAERCGPLPARERRFHAAFGLPTVARVLLFQGGFSVGRQLEHLVAAMASVRTPDVHLVLLGDGQLRQPLQQQAAAAGLQGRVHLHPAVPQSQLLAWTAAADAGVIPYQPTCLNNLYCTPNKLFEFIAAGLPILASDLPEIRAIVSGHGIGQLADLSSTDTIARAIDEFFADPARLEAWRGAVLRARQFLNWDVEGAKVVQLYESLR